MQQRLLYKNGPKVGAIGLGAMSFGGFFGETTKSDSFKVLDKCLELGITHLDTALVYGPYISEEVIGEYMKANPEKSKAFVIATKGGINPDRTGVDNSEAKMRELLEGSLKRLGVDYVDLYYAHRRDKTMPIEDIVGVLQKFIDEGKIGAMGLSEVSPSTLELASNEAYIGAVQSEYSLWTRLPELGMIQACKRRDTTFVPFSPVARGMLTDKGVDPSTFRDVDFRKTVPRFMEPQYSYNVERINKFKQYAHDNGHTTQALALAWVLHQDENCIPIPGTRTAEHLQEDAKGAIIKLSTKQLAEIEEILPAGFAAGNRYSDDQQKPTEQYC